jgi:hypothetical protein
MMIVTRFGSEIEITADCGDHTIPGFRSPVAIVRGTFRDGSGSCYFAVFTLRADGGFAELAEARARAPKVQISPAEVAETIERADRHF